MKPNPVVAGLAARRRVVSPFEGTEGSSSGCNTLESSTWHEASPTPVFGSIYRCLSLGVASPINSKCHISIFFHAWELAVRSLSKI
jgi:hypothetical protein